jgi:ATP-dependent RNA circularization protein (DNA/RNA ligase family)
VSEKKSNEILAVKGLLNQIKSTVETHSSRLEQMEHRISGLKELQKGHARTLRFHQKAKNVNHGH